MRRLFRIVALGGFAWLCFAGQYANAGQPKPPLNSTPEGAYRAFVDACKTGKPLAKFVVIEETNPLHALAFSRLVQDVRSKVYRLATRQLAKVGGKALIEVEEFVRPQGSQSKAKLKRLVVARQVRGHWVIHF
jgi:hypothetical protein